MISMFDQNKSNKVVEITNRQYYRSMIDHRDEASIIVNADGIILLTNSVFSKLLQIPEEKIEQLSADTIFFSEVGSSNPFLKKPLREFEQVMYSIDAERYVHKLNVVVKEIEGSYFLGAIHTVKDEPSNKTKQEPNNNVPQQKQEVSVETNSGDDAKLIEKLGKTEEFKLRNSLNTMMGFASILSKEPEIQNNRTLRQYVQAIITNGYGLKKMMLMDDKESTNTVISKVSLTRLLLKAQILSQAEASKNQVAIELEERDDIVLMTDPDVLLSILSKIINKAILVSRSMYVSIDYFEDDNSNAHIKIDNIGLEFPSEVIEYINISKGDYNLDDPVLSRHSDLRKMFKDLNSIKAKFHIEETGEMEQIAEIILPTYKPADDDAKGAGLTENKPEKRALAIEDDKMNAIVLKLFVEEEFQVTNAFSGNEALNIIEKFHKKGIIFDVVFMDIRLPEPWDGIKLKLEITKRWPEYENVKFIAQTAHSSNEYSEKIKNAGFSSYLIKPLNKNDVLNSFK